MSVLYIVTVLGVHTPNPVLFVYELRAAVKERGHSDLSHASATQGLQGDAAAQIHYIDHGTSAWPGSPLSKWHSWYYTTSVGMAKSSTELSFTAKSVLFSSSLDHCLR